MSVFAAEASLHWIGVGCYILALVLYAWSVIFDRPAGVSPAITATLGGLLAHGAGILVRWAEVGHGPYMLRYEVLSSNAWVAAACLTIFIRRRRRWAALALVVLPAVILMLGLGLMTSPGMRDLPPSLRSVWLIFHVSFAKLAAGAFLLSLAASILLLVGARRGMVGSWTARLPDEEALDAYTVRFIGFGFLFWTVNVGAGAIWAHEAWGRYWGWDPIETWSLITWLVYGIFLHARRFYRLRGKTSAWLAIACFGVTVLSVFILPYLLPSLHSAYFQ